MIEKLIIQDDQIFILDFRHRNQVLVFDTTGKFLFPVGTLGRGPGEFLETRNFTVDSNYIYIIDNSQARLLLYDHEGNHVTTKTLPKMAFDMAILGNGDYLFCRHYVEGANEKVNHKIIITDKDMNIKRELLPVDESDCFNMDKLNFFTRNDESIVFHTLLSDTLTFFNRHDATTRTTLYFDFTSRSIPMKWRSDFHKVTDKHQFLYETPFVTPKYIIGEDFSEFYIIDRAKGKSHPEQQGRGRLLYILPPIRERQRDHCRN